MRPTYLYRHFSANGELLYVGVSATPGARQVNHTHKSPWFDQVSRIDLARFDTTGAALDAERHAIENEHPKFNIIRSKINTQNRFVVGKRNMDVLRDLKDIFGGPTYKNVQAHFGVPFKELQRFMCGAKSIEGTIYTQFLEARKMENP